MNDWSLDALKNGCLLQKDLGRFDRVSPKCAERLCQTYRYGYAAFLLKYIELKEVRRYILLEYRECTFTTKDTDSPLLIRDRFTQWELFRIFQFLQSQKQKAKKQQKIMLLEDDDNGSLVGIYLKDYVLQKCIDEEQEQQTYIAQNTKNHKLALVVVRKDDYYLIQNFVSLNAFLGQHLELDEKVVLFRNLCEMVKRQHQQKKILGTFCILPISLCAVIT